LEGSVLTFDTRISCCRGNRGQISTFDIQFSLGRIAPARRCDPSADRVQCPLSFLLPHSVLAARGAHEHCIDSIRLTVVLVCDAERLFSGGIKSSGHGLAVFHHPPLCLPFCLASRSIKRHYLPTLRRVAIPAFPQFFEVEAILPRARARLTS
jgi:hypothetical protein